MVKFRILAFHAEPDTYPFGEIRSGGTGGALNETGRGFTGHRENRDIELTYMNARFYVPSAGRFASADTIVPDPGNPQAFNRYAYVNNNVVNFTDPSGHSSQKVFTAKDGGGPSTRNDVLNAISEYGGEYTESDIMGMAIALADFEANPVKFVELYLSGAAWYEDDRTLYLGMYAEAATNDVYGSSYFVESFAEEVFGFGAGTRLEMAHMINNGDPNAANITLVAGQDSDSINASSAPLAGGVSLMAWARKRGMNPNSANTQQLYNNRTLTVSEYISKFLKPKTRAVMPGEALDMTIDSVTKTNKIGGVGVKKLIVKKDFKK